MDAMRNKIDNPFNFSVDKSIAPLTDKVIIVTGGNQGIGLETVLQLSKHSPRRIYLGARTRAKYDGALAKIKEAPGTDASCIEFLELDLSSLTSVSNAAKQVISESDRLDILINSAGIMGAPSGVTKEGYEVHFGVNHLGHAFLVRLLLPLLEKSAEKPESDVRIVNVSSLAVGMAPSAGIIFNELKSSMDSFHSYRLYGQSKLANVLHAKELARRYPAITSTAVHPGRVSTGLLDGFFSSNPWNPASLFQKVYDSAVGMLTVEQGALTSLWASGAKKDELKSGAFYIPIGKEYQDKKCNDEKLAKELWDWQESEFEAQKLV